MYSLLASSFSKLLGLLPPQGLCITCTFCLGHFPRHTQHCSNPIEYFNLSTLHIPSPIALQSYHGLTDHIFYLFMMFLGCQGGDFGWCHSLLWPQYLAHSGCSKHIF